MAGVENTNGPPAFNQLLASSVVLLDVFYLFISREGSGAGARRVLSEHLHLLQVRAAEPSQLRLFFCGVPTE